MRIYKKVVSYIATAPFWLAVANVVLLILTMQRTGQILSDDLMSAFTDAFLWIKGPPFIREIFTNILDTIGWFEPVPYAYIFVNFFSWYLFVRVCYWITLAVTYVFELISHWLEGKLC